MATNVKAVRPNILSESESLTSFEDWKNHLLEFYLGQDKLFQDFLKAQTKWTKASSSTLHRSLSSAEKSKNLQHFLSVVASLAPPLSYGIYSNNTESLTCIYKLIRSYYNFALSESTFLKFATIKRELNGTELESLNISTLDFVNL